MKFFFTLILVTIITAVSAQTVKNNQVILGKTDSIRSKILNEKRKFWVYLPSGYDGAPKKFYPVLYLLDGDAHFASVAGMIQQLSDVNGNTKLPQMIVVAIPNTDRTRDLTPTNSMLDPGGKKVENFKTSGGGEKFTSFIEKELMPHIDSVYNPAPYKVLVGHSFGGLTVMNIVINHTDMFNAYIAIDPSMWWDGRKLLTQASEVFKQKKFSGRSLFLGIANTMPDGMDTLQAQRDTSGSATGHIRSILALKNVILQNPSNGLSFSYKYYNDDSHSSVPLITEYDGLRFLFGFYDFPNGFQSKVVDKNVKMDLGAALTEHYADVSKHMGYTILPPEDMVNQLAYYLLQIDMPDRAYALFNLNVKNYPASANVWDSMGDYYEHQKNKAKAIEFYTRSLKVHENIDTRSKLNKLVK